MQRARQNGVGGWRGFGRRVRPGLVSAWHASFALALPRVRCIPAVAARQPPLPAAGARYLLIPATYGPVLIAPSSSRLPLLSLLSLPPPLFGPRVARSRAGRGGPSPGPGCRGRDGWVRCGTASPGLSLGLCLEPVSQPACVLAAVAARLPTSPSPYLMSRCRGSYGERTAAPPGHRAALSISSAIPPPPPGPDLPAPHPDPGPCLPPPLWPLCFPRLACWPDPDPLRLASQRRRTPIPYTPPRGSPHQSVGAGDTN